MTDQFSIDSVDKLLKLLDGGDFHAEFMQANADLQLDMRNHQQEHGGKPKGEITLKLGYQLQKSGDVGITGKLTVKAPDKPAASGVAYSDGEGQLTLYSPMMRRMDVRDPTPATPRAIK